jgi:hypothetical protein
LGAIPFRQLGNIERYMLLGPEFLNIPTTTNTDLKVVQVPWPLHAVRARVLEYLYHNLKVCVGCGRDIQVLWP